jgi:short-subunit dehydrogenase
MRVSKGTALITGASAGIGLELARCFARGRHDLVLVARREDKLREIALEVTEQHGVRAQVLAADLSEPDAGPRLAQVLAERNTSVDVLVNNAGFAEYGPFAESDADVMSQVLAVNVSALTLLSRALLPSMIESARRDGRRQRILNVASTAGFLPGPLMAVYYASKAYVLSLSEALANELREQNISVTCLCPGPTQSEFQGVAKMQSSKLSESVLMNAATVARAGYAGCMRGQVLVVPGTSNKAATWVPRLLPRALTVKIVRRIRSASRARRWRSSSCSCGMGAASSCARLGRARLTKGCWKACRRGR